MKAVSLRINDATIQRGLTAAVRPEGIWVRHTEKGILLDHHSDYLFSLSGATIDRFDEGRSVGSAAVGAIVGGVLTGGLGAVAGAALGGRKKHSMVMQHDSALVVLEMSTSELQTIIGRGVSLGQRTAGEPRITKKSNSSVTMLTVVLIFIAGIFVLAAVVRK